MSKREQSPAPSSQDMMDDVDISTTPPSPPHTGTKASAPHSSTPHCMRSRTKAFVKVALVVFSRNDAGNAFWERFGFTARGDLTYRNKALCSITRIDT